MKTCGIDIQENKVRFIILEKESGVDHVIENSTNFFELKKPSSPQDLAQFRDTLYAFFDDNNFDKVGILARTPSGKFSSHGTSFKVEGILQLYPRKDIELYAKATISAFLKKNTCELKTKTKNQSKALDLAHFLLNSN